MNRYRMTLSRRDAFRRFAGLLAASPLAAQSADPDFGRYLPERLPPLEELINAHDFERIARSQLPRAAFDHVAAGTGNERTLRQNRAFFDRVTFRPRFLKDTTGLTLSTQLLGETLFAPILVAPMSDQRLVHPDAESATAAGAAKGKALAVWSEHSSLPIDEIARSAPGPFWYQILPGTETATVDKAVRAGARALVVSIGYSAAPLLDRDLHHRRRHANLIPAAATAFSWESIGHLRRQTGLPVLVKGVLSATEATAALEHGASGLIVSNHGGRGIDGVPAAVEVLPVIAAAVNGRAPLIVDGGFRRGIDILKGLALGAQAVLIGRPVLWALAAYGADGVTKLLQVLQYELALAMGLSGCADLGAVSPALVKVHRW